MGNEHPWQLKKSTSWEPVWSYYLNSTANAAFFLSHLSINGLDWQWCSAGGSKKASKIDCLLEINSIISQVPLFSSYEKFFLDSVIALRSI